MHPKKEAVDTFYPEKEPDSEPGPETVETTVTTPTIVMEMESTAKPTTSSTLIAPTREGKGTLASLAKKVKT